PGQYAVTTENRAGLVVSKAPSYVPVVAGRVASAQIDLLALPAAVLQDPPRAGGAAQAPPSQPTAPAPDLPSLPDQQAPPPAPPPTAGPSRTRRPRGPPRRLRARRSTSTRSPASSPASSRCSIPRSSLCRTWPAPASTSGRRKAQTSTTSR